jgi:hypothetical protein
MAKRTYYFAGTYGRIETERTGTQLKQVDLVESLETENKDLQKQNQHLMKLLTEARAEIERLKG